MVEEELKKKILDIIYNEGQWYFEATANGNVDQYYLDNEDEVVEKIVKVLREKIIKMVEEYE